MKKIDLKTGMWVETRRGEKYIVLLNTTGDDTIANTDGFIYLEEYDDSLSLRNPKSYTYDATCYDIMKIYDYNHNINPEDVENPIWEREEEKKEPINISINMTINEDSVKDIEMIIEELQNKLRNIKIGFTY